MALLAGPLQLLSGPSFKPTRATATLLLLHPSYWLHHPLSSPHPPVLGPHCMHTDMQRDLLTDSTCRPDGQTRSQMTMIVLSWHVSMEWECRQCADEVLSTEWLGNTQACCLLLWPWPQSDDLDLDRHGSPVWQTDRIIIAVVCVQWQNAENCSFSSYCFGFWVSPKYSLICQ